MSEPGPLGRVQRRVPCALLEVGACCPPSRDITSHQAHRAVPGPPCVSPPPTPGRTPNTRSPSHREVIGQPPEPAPNKDNSDLPDPNPKGGKKRGPGPQLFPEQTAKPAFVREESPVPPPLSVIAGPGKRGRARQGPAHVPSPPPPAGYNPGTLARPARTWYRRSAMRRVVGAKGASGGDRGEGSRGLSGCVVSCPRGLWRTILARVSAGHVGGAGRSLMRRSGLLATLQPLPDARASPGKNRAHPSLPPRGATPA